MVKLNGRLGLVENSVGIVTLTMRCGGKTERLFGFDYFTFPVIFFYRLYPCFQFGQFDRSDLCVSLTNVSYFVNLPCLHGKLVVDQHILNSMY